LVLTGGGCTINPEFVAITWLTILQPAKLTIDCCNTIIDPLG